MVNLLSKKSIKANKDVQGYTTTCNAYCSDCCTGGCDVSCTSGCKFACGGCDTTCSSFCHRAVF